MRGCLSYFYPRSPCGERPGGKIQDPGQVLISIHALLAESDTGTTSAKMPRWISIHALLAESDAVIVGLQDFGLVFLSTLSLRRATIRAYQRYFAPDISIHALLAESDPKCQKRDFAQSISIHALLAESDSKSAQNSGVLLRI